MPSDSPMSRPTSRPPPSSTPKATPVLRVFVMSIAKNTFALSPRAIEAMAICLVAWSRTTTAPAVATARARPRAFGPMSAADDSGDDAADDQQHEGGDDRAQVERPRPHSKRGYHAAEEVQVRVRHVADEGQNRGQDPVVRNPRDPAHDDPDEDQHQVDQPQRVHVLGDVGPADGVQQAHFVASTTVSTAVRHSSRMPPSSRLSRPFSVTPPGVATRLRSSSVSSSWRSSQAAVPAMVSTPIPRASPGSRPCAAPASANASATSALNAGPPPMTAIA